MNRPEEQLQRAVVQLLAIYERRGLLAYCAVPNGGYRTPAEAGILNAMGVRRGVPDLLLWTPHGRSFGVELKAGRGPTRKSSGNRRSRAWATASTSAGRSTRWKPCCGWKACR
jgi:hypothetical protein